MRLWFTSDNHTDSHPLNWQWWEELALQIQHDPPDFLLVGGDLAESLEDFERALALISSPLVQKIIVPGNHDLWCRKDSRTSWQKLEEDLPGICKRQNWHWLPHQPLESEGVGIAGSMSWYDYSMLPKDHPFTHEELVQRARAGRRFMDGVWCDFSGWDNHTLDQRLTQKLEDELHEDLKKIAQARLKIVMTHFPMQKKFLNFRKTDWDFEYFGAYMGNATGFPRLLEAGVNLHLSGHLHREGDISEAGLRSILSPVGYVKEWEVRDVKEWFSRRLLKLDICPRTGLIARLPAQS